MSLLISLITTSTSIAQTVKILKGQPSPIDGHVLPDADLKFYQERALKGDTQKALDEIELKNCKDTLESSSHALTYFGWGIIAGLVIGIYHK